MYYYPYKMEQIDLAQHSFDLSSPYNGMTLFNAKYDIFFIDLSMLWSRLLFMMQKALLPGKFIE